MLGVKGLCLRPTMTMPSHKQEEDQESCLVLEKGTLPHVYFSHGQRREGGIP